MSNPIEFAEKVNSTNYAAMSYYELVTINLAFLLALGEVKPLMEKKRTEEMDAHTHEFVAKMNNYGASKAEILACLEKEAMREIPYGPLPSQDVEEQTPTSKAEDNQDKGEEELALPHPENTDGGMDVIAEDEVPDSDSMESNEAAEEDSAASSSTEDSLPVNSEREDGVEIPVTKEQEYGNTISLTPGEHDFVEEALETLKALTVPDYINVNAPYYVDGTFAYGDTAKPGYSNPKWRNMGRKDLEDFRDASVNYEKLFLKHEVLVSTDEYLVVNESLNSIRVRMYHFPKQYHAGAETISQNYDDLQDLSEDEIRARKFWLSLLKKAIKQAKEFSFLDGTDTNTPFYDRYKFSRDNKTLNLFGDRVRYYEDVNTLSEIMPSYETYARLYINRSLVLAKDNCVATVSEGKIYLVLFNIPPQKKRRCETKKARPVIMEESAPVISKSDACTSPVQRERDLILEAVEMTRNQSVINGSDNSSFSIQQNFFVTKDGGLFCDGKPFITTISDEVLEKNKALHRKYARTMKASSIISTDNYTAYIWNEGRSLTVFYYNTNTQAETVS